MQPLHEASPIRNNLTSNPALPDVGGALRLGGATTVRDCSFVANSASTRGLAVAVVDSANITLSSFDGNAFDCEAGEFLDEIRQVWGAIYRKYTYMVRCQSACPSLVDFHQQHPTSNTLKFVRRSPFALFQEGSSLARFEIACFGCPGWDEDQRNSIANGEYQPICSIVLEHTTADEPGATLETLSVSPGYWRATRRSDTVLACYNSDACLGGQTGEDSYCAAGYTGPCESARSARARCVCVRNKIRKSFASTMYLRAVQAMHFRSNVETSLDFKLSFDPSGCRISINPASAV